MYYTKEEFKRLWKGGGIKDEDCTDCAKAWGICSRPKSMPLQWVIDRVVEAAGCYVSKHEKVYINWHKFPYEQPTEEKEYLVRGIGGIDNRLHHWVCLWVNERKQLGVPKRFYYRGNLFHNDSGVFEWLDLESLNEENEED